MSIINRFYNRYKLRFYVAIIVVSIAGSFLMMAAVLGRTAETTSQLKQQNQALQNQLEAINNFNASRDKAVADLKADNARQTVYLECLLALNGAPLDAAAKSSCATKASAFTSPDTDTTQSTSSKASGPKSSSPAKKPVDKTPTPPQSNHRIGCLPLINICV